MGIHHFALFLVSLHPVAVHVLFVTYMFCILRRMERIRQHISGAKYVFLIKQVFGGLV